MTTDLPLRVTLASAAGWASACQTGQAWTSGRKLLWLERYNRRRWPGSGEHIDLSFCACYIGLMLKAKVLRCQLDGIMLG